MRADAPADDGPVAILAGSGELPLLVADRLAARGRPHRILAFRGFASRTLARRADAVVGLLDVGRVAACLEGWNPAGVTLAGGVRRPGMGALFGAFSGWRNRAELARVLRRGDDTLLRGAVSLLEERGHTLVGVHEIAPELLAEPGPYGAVRPDEDARLAIALGMRLLDSLSPFDIGQAAVVRGERVVAIEGPEGTDATLVRAAAQNRGRLFRPIDQGGVLVKAPKRGQDLRVDLPAIGPRTIVNAARARLSGVAVASGLTLVLHRDETVRLADRLGLFLVGVERGPAS